MTVTNWPHQDRALRFLDARRDMECHGSMLGMDMGTGKSRVAIQYCDRQSFADVLVLCPKVVLSVWPDQFKEHSEREWYAYAVNPKQSIQKRFDKASQVVDLARTLDRPLALILNYDAVWRSPFAAWVKSHKWDCVIFDESHRLKAPGGKASRYCARIPAREKLALTGTPMPHSPLDLYAQWRALDWRVFGTSYQRFKSRYAVIGGYENRQVVGFHDLDDMKERAGRGTFVVNKRDVLDLPPVTVENVPVVLSPATMKQYTHFERELVLQLEQGEVTADNALTKLLRLQQITSGYVKSDDGEIVTLGTDKEDALYDLLFDLPRDEPVVVFARFHQDLDKITRIASEQRRHYYELSGRVNSLEMWKRDKGVLAVQIQAGGVGIDLTKAAYGIYYSVGFSLGDYQQSLARLDRPGQTRPVTIYHLIAQETVDVKVHAALAAKRNVIEAVVNGMGRATGQPLAFQ